MSGLSYRHGLVLQLVVEWCDSSHLELKISRTKEQQNQQAEGPDFSRHHHYPSVEQVESKYLVIIFDHLLKFASKTEETHRKCQEAAMSP